MRRERDLRKIIAHYGYKNQKNIAIEEMSELIKELCKNNRGELNTPRIAEEIADVQIMLNQLIIHLGIKAEVEGTVDIKIDRQLERMDNE